MKKKIFLIFTCLMFVSCVKENVAHNEVKEPTRFILNNGVQGFFDENKKVIFLEEGSLYPFYDGYCIKVNSVEQNNCMYNTVIDTNGQKKFDYMVELIYDVFHSSEGYFLCYDEENNNENYVLKDSSGNAIDTLYVYGRSVHNGYYATRNNDDEEMFYKNVDGSVLKHFGKVFKSHICYDFNFGNAVVVDEEGRYGLIDLKGNQVLPYKYTFLTGQKYNRIAASDVAVKQDYGFLPEFGLIDFNGKWIVEKQYYKIIQASEDVVAVKELPLESRFSDNGWSFINLETMEKIKIDEKICLDSFIELNGIESTFYDGISIFHYFGKNKYGLINDKGEIVLEAIYDRIMEHPDNGYWNVNYEGNWYLFREDEGMRNPLEYLDFSLVE